MVKNVDDVFDKPPSKIFWYYSENQAAYENGERDGITFINSLPDVNEIKNFEYSLVILDDLMYELRNSPDLIKIFTKGCHHWRISVIFIVQNLFFEGLRNSRINSDYLILMKNPSDRLQIRTLSIQLYPGKTNYFQEVFDDATSKPHGYLLVDLTQSTPDEYRLRTNIVSKNVIVYVPKV
jgi:hypothetical protein